MEATASTAAPRPILEVFSEHYCIPKEILGKYCVTGEKTNLPGSDLPVEAVSFCYGPFSEPDALKWRSLRGGQEHIEGWPKSLFGIDQLPEDRSTLVITQSELDCLSFASAGIASVSLPLSVNRIESGKVHSSEDIKLSALGNSIEVLEAAQKVILATHSSEQGDALAEEVARRVGRAKCWRLAYPDDAKTASRLLRKHGPEALQKAAGEAKPLPLEGVYTANDYAADVRSLYDEGMPEGLFCGIPGTEELYRVCPGQLSVVTGTPSAGKSAGVDQIMMHLAKEHEWKFAVCSMENPPRLHIAKLSAIYANQPFFDGPTPRMSNLEREKALGFINDHFCFLESMAGGGTSMESIIDRTKQAILRMGVRGLVIDPFNYIDSEGDPDSIRKMLRAICTFAKSHDLHVWFVAHPAKMYRGEDGAVRVPGGYDIAGAAHWFNAADAGLTFHRTKEGNEFHVWKARFMWTGKLGKAELGFDPPTGTFCRRVVRDRWGPPA
jgi:twinkle protein